MPRPSAGSFDVIVLADGTRAFQLRFPVNGVRERVILHEREGCTCGCGGGWDEASARTELGNEMARVRVGVWRRRPPPPMLVVPNMTPGEVPTFHEYASWWLQAKIDGTIGETGGIDENTIRDYRWRVCKHLLPFFGPYPLDQIDADLCLAFKTRKFADARELCEAIEAGADLRDHRRRRLKPLGRSSIAKLIGTLAAILDEAVEDEHIPVNPARRKRMKVKVPKPLRTFLERDELAALLDAAAEQDKPLAKVKWGELGPTATLVAHLLSQGKRPKQIAKALGVNKSTVSWHLSRMGANVGRGYVGRRAICEILGRSGVRVSELCDLRIGHVRVHDPRGARFKVTDSKTETGIRDVEMTPELVEVVIEHIDNLRRAGHPTGPEDYLVQNTHGGRLARQRVGKILHEAVEAASAKRVREGLPSLPAVTPHAMRRTYISLALVSNEFDVKWVMGQVGHADSKMTLDVYAQLEQRNKRDHGASFDALIRAAGGRPGEERMVAEPPADVEAALSEAA
jgi:integrase